MNNKYELKARNLKRAVLEIACATGTHHIGSCLSMADLLTVLYFRTLKINPRKPDDPKRDRFILSKGHASLALYIALMQRGFFSKADFEKHYAIDGGRMGYHPDKGSMPGVEATTGSLGHGLSVGTGLALAAKISKPFFRAFVMLGDGECNEGSIWEAAMFASQHKLDNLVAVVDYNHLQGFGRTEEVLNLEPFIDKWRAFGWAAQAIDGHNIKNIIDAFDNLPFEKEKPSVIIANTIKGKNVPCFENKLESHYHTINEDELKAALESI